MIPIVWCRDCVAPASDRCLVDEHDTFQAMVVHADSWRLRFENGETAPSRVIPPHLMQRAAQARRKAADA